MEIIIDCMGCWEFTNYVHLRRWPRWSVTNISVVGSSLSINFEIFMPSSFSMSPCRNHSKHSNADHRFDKKNGLITLLKSAHLMIICRNNTTSPLLLKGGPLFGTAFLAIFSDPSFFASPKFPRYWLEELFSCPPSTPFPTTPTSIVSGMFGPGDWYGLDISKGRGSTNLVVKLPRISAWRPMSVARMHDITSFRKWRWWGSSNDAIILTVSCPCINNKYMGCQNFVYSTQNTNAPIHYSSA